MNHNNTKKFIYIAAPWGALGGGTYKVADYIIQAHQKKDSHFQLIGLDTRGSKAATYSIFYLIKSFVMIFQGKLSGQLMGVHINMAERLSAIRKGSIILFCRFIGVPTVLHLHAAQFPIFYNSSPNFFQKIVRYFFKFPEKIMVLGETAQKFVAHELLVDSAKIQIVPNGVPAAIYPRREFDQSKKFEILFLGNLSGRKGVTDLIQAIAAKLLTGDTNFILRLAGGGDIEGYKKFASENLLDTYVSFEGWADQQSASQLLANADILILPSYDEGLPLVILEAMANGVAVICTPVGEIPHFIKPEENAIFVAPGDIAGISNAISRLQNDTVLREKIELANVRDFNAFFSIEKFYEEVVRNYEQVFNLSSIKS